jgi:hypothetical protein
MTCRPGFKWSHEDASEMMLDYLIDDNHIDLEKHQINFIKDLIAGTPRSKRYESISRIKISMLAILMKTMDIANTMSELSCLTL